MASRAVRPAAVTSDTYVLAAEAVYDDVGADPDAWRAGAEGHAGSWWEGWAGWIKARAGRRRQPFRIGGNDHPVLADAPGTYARS